MNEIFHHAANNFMIPADTDLLPTADIAFIFGNKQIIPELASRTSQLYRKGRVDKIIATGGVKLPHGQTEAEELYRELKSRGVPGKNILIEDRSRNTEENITLGKKIIDDEIGLENIASVIGVGHAAAGPRFLMTLARRWPNILPMHVSVFPSSVNPRRWHEDEPFLQKAFNDKAKLPLYGHMGYLAPILPDHINHLIRDRKDLFPEYSALKVS